MDADNSGYLDYGEFMGFLEHQNLNPDAGNEGMFDLTKVRYHLVVRGAIAIKYAAKKNKDDQWISEYLLKQGLTKIEVNEAWKHFRHDTEGIPDINLGDRKKFNDFTLMKLVRRVGHTFQGAEQFSDIEVLRASGNGSRVSLIRCWYDGDGINGLQIIY